MDSQSEAAPINLSGSTSGDVNYIQIIDKGCITSNLSTFSVGNPSYKNNKPVSSGKEKKRTVRSAPNG